MDYSLLLGIHYRSRRESDFNIDQLVEKDASVPQRSNTPFRRDTMVSYE
jgi:hypothetical protein